MKLDPAIDITGFGLSTRILDHALADVYAHKGHPWIGLGRLYKPATRPTTDIQHATKDSRVGLLWQHTAHRSCDHLILDRQTDKFFLALPILNKVRTGEFFH